MHCTSKMSIIFNKFKLLNSGSVCALYLLFVIILIARFCNLDKLSHSKQVIANCKWDKITSHEAKILNTLCGLFYCDISDHLPSFLSSKFEKYNCVSERPMTRIFGERNCHTFIQLMESENWETAFSVTENDWYNKFLTIIYGIYQQSFPLVRVSRKRRRDKPWISKALKISIKQKKKQLYKRSVLNHNQKYHVKYNAYKTLLRKCLNEAEVMYYNQLFEANKDSVYNLWKTLNPIINPKKM